MNSKQYRTPYVAELVLAVDVMAACIETGVHPAHGSKFHRILRKLVDQAGWLKPKRKRRRFPCRC